MKKNVFAALLGSVLFMAGFALATGVDANPVQAIYAIALFSLSAAAWYYADRTAYADHADKAENAEKTINIKKAA